MYGQMTAGSWIYIGTQGILQGTYETLAELARRQFGGSLAGRLVVTAGLGGMSLEQALNDVGLDLRRRTEDDDQIAQGRTRSLLFVNDAAAHDRVDGDSVQDFR